MPLLLLPLTYRQQRRLHPPALATASPFLALEEL